MRANGGVQGRGRVPGLVAHTGHKFTGRARALQRQRLAVDGDHMAAFVHARHAHLDALQRRVHIAHGAARRAFFAHHMPGLQRVAQGQLHAHRFHRADHGEAELELRRKPGGVKCITCSVHLGHHVVHVLLDEGGQHPAVVQLGAPAGGGRAVGRLPEAGDQGAQQQLLHHAHVGVGRHLKGAQLQQAQAAGAAVGREHLVDAEFAAVRVARHVHQDVAQRAVHQPGRHVLAVDGAVGLDLAQRDFQFVELVVAGLVHTRRLAGGADEQAAEQIAQAGVVVPVQQQAGQQLGLAQEGRVGRGGAAHHKVVATAGAGVASIGHELLGRQARLPRGLVQKLGVLHQLLPVAGGVDVHLDHAGVGRHGQHLQACVARRRVAFEHDLHAQLFGRGLDGGQQVQVVVQARQRGHEDVEHAVLLTHLLGLGAARAARVAHLHAQGGA